MSERRAAVMRGVLCTNMHAGALPRIAPIRPSKQAAQTGPHLISRFRSDTRGYFRSPTPPSLRSAGSHTGDVVDWRKRQRSVIHASGGVAGCVGTPRRAGGRAGGSPVWIQARWENWESTDTPRICGREGEGARGQDAVQLPSSSCHDRARQQHPHLTSSNIVPTCTHTATHPTHHNPPRC